VIRIAVLGCGRIGRVHAQTIARTSGVAVAAVTDPIQENAAAAAALCGADVSTIDAVEADRTIDAVAICTPTKTHADLIERFARAGKAIFCEKPIDLDSERVRACLDVVRACDATLMVGFNRRFDPHFQALKAAIDAGRIGRIEQVAITSRDPAPPPRDYTLGSGGLFRDMTIHDFDMARFLVDAPFTSVHAVASAMVDPSLAAHGEVDVATVVLTAATGAQVVISNSRRAAYGYDQRIEVAGALGMIEAQNPPSASVVVADAGGYHAPPLDGFFMTRYAAAYAAEIEAFAAALRGDGPAAPTGDDGLKALLLADAAAASLASGGPMTIDV